MNAGELSFFEEKGISSFQLSAYIISLRFQREPEEDFMHIKISPVIVLSVWKNSVAAG